MAKRSDQKTLIILLSTLGIVVVGCAIWLYNILKPTEFILEVQTDLQYIRLGQVKEDAIKNVQDFIKIQSAPDSVWDDFYGSDQYKSLEDYPIEIDTENNVGNPSPFLVTTSTDGEAER